jgi:chromate transporter
MPWARRMMVEERRWLTEAQFVDILALCQLLPGPNIVNVSIAVGTRFHGVTGALAAFTGLMVAPITLVIVLGLLYAGLDHLAPLRAAFSGISAVAAGMVIAMAFRIAGVLRRRPAAIAIALVAFAGAGIMRWPLAWLVVVLAPVSVAIAARSR